MKQKFYLFAALCAAAMVSCKPSELEIDNPELEVPSDNLITMTITASLQEFKADMVDVLWTWKSGDKLAVFDGTDKREFTLDESAAGSDVAKFSAVVPSTFTPQAAVFPYEKAGDTFSTPLIPAEQTVADDQTIDAAAMIATSTTCEKEGDDFVFYFDSGISFLRFTPPAGATKVILCAATDGDVLAGTSPMVKVNLKVEGKQAN